MRNYVNGKIITIRKLRCHPGLAKQRLSRKENVTRLHGLLIYASSSSILLKILKDTSGPQDTNIKTNASSKRARLKTSIAVVEEYLLFCYKYQFDQENYLEDKHVLIVSQRLY